MAKKKVETLTQPKGDYISEKVVVINGEEAWLVKKNNHIKVTKGEEVLYDGTSRAFHRWLKEQENSDK